MIAADSRSKPRKRSKSRFVRVLLLLLATLMLPAALWCCGAIYYGVASRGHVPALLCTAAFLTIWPIFAWRSGLARALGAFAVSFLVVLAAWQLRTPSNHRTWSSDQARLPRAEFHGTRVTLHNLRYAKYRSATDYGLNWYTQSFDLDRIAGVDFIVEPFDIKRPGLAHTFLSFGFDDGEHLAVSVEIRKEQGESFHPLPGLFRQYEIMYVAGDERDLIGLRTEIRKDPVYVYPLRAEPEKTRALFAAICDHMNKLNDKPEFYNSLTNTCMTNILRRVEEVTDRSFGFDLRIALPGYSDELVHELGAIDFEGSLDEARSRFLINSRASLGPPTPDRVGYSRQIRRPPASPTLAE